MLKCWTVENRWGFFPVFCKILFQGGYDKLLFREGYVDSKWFLSSLSPAVIGRWALGWYSVERNILQIVSRRLWDKSLAAPPIFTPEERKKQFLKPYSVRNGSRLVKFGKPRHAKMTVMHGWFVHFLSLWLGAWGGGDRPDLWKFFFLRVTNFIFLPGI